MAILRASVSQRSPVPLTLSRAPHWLALVSIPVWLAVSCGSCDVVPPHSVTQRLVEVVAEARPPVDFELRVTMSGGYACCPDHTASPEALFTLADKALFKAKAEGRNRVCRPATD